MSRKNLKYQLYEQLARIGKAFASPRRLELLEVLAQGERPVEALAAATGTPVPNCSHHLQVLREARLVEARKEGLYVYYHLADPDVFGLGRMIRLLAERHIAEVERIMRNYLGGCDGLEPIGREELLKRAAAGTVLVLDVRPEVEYRAGHIAGAISIPLPDLERRIADIPPDKEIVAYCRGPYCVMALEAVRILQSHDRRATRLEDGFPEWRSAGLPVNCSSVESAS
jgi:rhodanese-related sulfurtransferase